ncbi:hypothetical protein Pan181_29320 [Aeoliella mucimassa]|uniref:Uncharacterized protein n=1 Tax=Aeoliella mucimassa TaxID=2527972 RepID=A0A518APS9_9BACT|nr:hypothetical protein Pan181_29320 [Aeoliella mucimassa]
MNQSRVDTWEVGLQLANVGEMDARMGGLRGSMAGSLPEALRGLRIAEVGDGCPLWRKQKDPASGRASGV